MTDRLTLPPLAAALVLAKRITAYGLDTAPTVTCRLCDGLGGRSVIRSHGPAPTWERCFACKGHGMVPLTVGPVELWSDTEAPEYAIAGEWTYDRAAGSIFTVPTVGCGRNPGKRSIWHPAPLGVCLGTVNITAIVPIVDRMEHEHTDWFVRLVEPDDWPERGTLAYHYAYGEYLDISDQRQYSTFTPGGVCAIIGDAP